VTDRNPFNGRGGLAAGGLALFAAGALASYLLAGRWSNAPDRPASAPVTQPALASKPAAPRAIEFSGPLPDVRVPVAAEMARRAGIEVTTARSAVIAERLRLPGTVEPNQYRQVVVTPLVSGRVTSVTAQLGAAVSRGTALAEIYSSELADAQTKYIGMRADLAAADQRLTRTSRLVEIGAASRQELESVQADRTRLAAEVEGAASRLRLLGLSGERLASMSTPAHVAGTVTVRAPSAGVVTERKANIGLVVDTATQLFTVTSLSPVWVIADVHERDLGKVRVGSIATVTSDGSTDVLQGTITYVAPDVRAETRTAQARVELANPGGRLRFGMFVNVEVMTPGTRAGVVVPADAVQAVGSRYFVYVAAPGPGGAYLEREVTVSARDGNVVEVLHGLVAGDVVVTAGSFLVRAERERLGLRAPAVEAATPEPSRTVKITASDTAFEPARVEVRQGERVVLEFTRVSETSCATEVSVPSLQIRKALPLNVPVRVDLRAAETGEIAFSCGMAMLKGTVVVR